MVFVQKSKSIAKELFGLNQVVYIEVVSVQNKTQPSDLYNNYRGGLCTEVKQRSFWDPTK